MVATSTNELGDTRRKFPRIGTDIVVKLIPNEETFKIELKVTSKGVVLEGLLTDVSKGGIGFISEGNLTIGDIVNTLITFNGKNISCTVLIKHSLVIGEASCVGAKFIDINPEDKAYIDGIIDVAMEKYLGF